MLCTIIIYAALTWPWHFARALDYNTAGALASVDWHAVQRCHLVSSSNDAPLVIYDTCLAVWTSLKASLRAFDDSFAPDHWSAFALPLREFGGVLPVAVIDSFRDLLNARRELLDCLGPLMYSAPAVENYTLTLTLAYAFLLVQRGSAAEPTIDLASKAHSFESFEQRKYGHEAENVKHHAGFFWLQPSLARSGHFVLSAISERNWQRCRNILLPLMEPLLDDIEKHFPLTMSGDRWEPLPWNQSDALRQYPWGVIFSSAVNLLHCDENDNVPPSGIVERVVKYYEAIVPNVNVQWEGPLLPRAWEVPVITHYPSNAEFNLFSHARLPFVVRVRDSLGQHPLLDSAESAAVSPALRAGLGKIISSVQSFVRDPTYQDTDTAEALLDAEAISRGRHLYTANGGSNPASPGGTFPRFYNATPISLVGARAAEVLQSIGWSVGRWTPAYLREKIGKGCSSFHVLGTQVDDQAPVDKHCELRVNARPPCRPSAEHLQSPANMDSFGLFQEYSWYPTAKQWLGYVLHPLRNPPVAPFPSQNITFLEDWRRDEYCGASTSHQGKCPITTSQQFPFEPMFPNMDPFDEFEYYSTVQVRLY